jgi:hypothetical protein
LLSTRSEESRKRGGDDLGVGDENSNHLGILHVCADEIESESRALRLVASRTGDPALLSGGRILRTYKISAFSILSFTLGWADMLA